MMSSESRAVGVGEASESILIQDEPTNVLQSTAIFVGAMIVGDGIVDVLLTTLTGVQTSQLTATKELGFMFLGVERIMVPGGIVVGVPIEGEPLLVHLADLALLLLVAQVA